MTTIEEARELRLKAEATIRDTLRELAEATGCELDLRLRKTTTMAVGGEARHVYDVEIEVVL